MISQQLRQLRQARGLSLEELAHAADAIVTKQAISKYEQGKAHPTPQVLQRLAAALGVRPADLLAPGDVAIELVAYRRRSSLGKRQQAQIAALAREAIQLRVRLLRLVGAPAAPDLPLLHYPVAGPAEAEAAADDLRARWGLGGAPIADLTDTLEDHAVHVIPLAAASGFDGVAAIARAADGSPLAAAVVMRSGQGGARQRMSLAHELGHLVLRPLAGLDEEQAAFRFAAALLAPAGDLRSHVGERRAHLHVEELLLLKRHFGISIQALLLRLRTLGIISAAYYREWAIELGQRGWRRDEPGELPAEAPTWLRRTALRALAEGLIGAEEAGRLLGEPAAAAGPPAGPCRAMLGRPASARHADLADQAAAAAALYPPAGHAPWQEGDLVEHA